MAAPSFSSFPPVFGSFPDLEEAGSSSRSQTTKQPEFTKVEKQKDKRRTDSEGRDKEKKKRRHESEKREKKGERKHERRDKVERDTHGHSSNHHRRRSVSYDKELNYGNGKSASQEGINRIYYIDGKGDELNIRYGSLHSGDIPKYWHVARGRKVLGLDTNLAVLYRGSKGLEIGEAGWFGGAPQLTSSRSRALLAPGNARRLATSGRAADRYQEVDGFIRVPSRKGKEKGQTYRPIALDEEEGSNSDSSQGESESSDGHSDVSLLPAREETLRNLEQRLAENPGSETTWLSLLHHSISNIDPTSKNAERARAEISVSIFDRALSALPTNARSPLLRLKYLKAGEAVWDVARMKGEWQKALKAIPTADVYVEWLDWAIRIGPDFNTVVERAIEATDLVASNGDDEDSDFAKLRVLWRIATFFRQAGYIERGFALFQAQVELTFNVPEGIESSPFQNRLDALEEFWESEVPRVGEEGAKGWRAWGLGEGSNGSSKSSQIGKCQSSDPQAIWLYNEVESDRRLIFPSRLPSNEGSDHLGERDEEIPYDDPYAAILFSDIRLFLADLRTSKGKDILRLIWLSYLGLHIPGLSSVLSSGQFVSDDRWADTYFLRPAFVQALFPRNRSKHGMITADAQFGVLVGRQKTYAKAFEAIKSWSLGVLEPLEGLTVDGAYRSWSKGCLDGLDPELIEVMSRVFRDIGYKDDSPLWNIAELAFEASFPQDEHAYKRSQALLAENSSSAELLASHAYLERIRRKYEKARKVYRVGLQSLARTSDPSVVCMWWGSAELEWQLSKNDAALEIILCSVGRPKEKSGVNILRAKHRLEELCHPSTVPEWRYRLKWIKLRMLLELLVGSLDSTIEASQRLVGNEETRSIQHESLTVAVLLMLYHHTVTLHNPAPPAALRHLVREALDTYPSNSIIVGIFLECEKGESVWGRVRTLMSDGHPEAHGGKSIARRLIEVWIGKWEEGRWLGEVERVRAGLETAVTSDRTKGSPILWKVYVKLELASGNTKRAKAVLFRALKDCPLVKELYLLAFEEDLRHAYTRGELMALSDTMAERGIRLRRSLGELLDIHGADEQQERETDSETSEEGYEDELEFESRERKRLMPY